MRIKLLLAGFAELSLALLFGSTIVTTGSFIVALTPEQALRKGYPPIPAHWEAAVMNKGSYYQWLTIWDHPFLFALSLLSLIACVFGLHWVQKRWTFQLGERRAESIAAPSANSALFIGLTVLLAIVISELKRVPNFLGMAWPVAWGVIAVVAVLVFRLLGGRINLHWKTRQ